MAVSTITGVSRFKPPRWARIAGIVFALVLVPGVLKLDVHTDMRTLYSMSESLKRSEALNARLNNLGISANYFIVEGSSEQELLENEEALSARLQVAVKDSLMRGFLATSSYIPSVKTQQETFEGVQSLRHSQALQELLESLNVPSDSLFESGFASPAYLEPSSKIPSSFASILDMLWIGEVDGRFYSAVFPLHVAAGFDIAKQAAELPHVYAVNKMENVNETLTQLSRVALLLVAIAYAVVFLVLVFVYGFVPALRSARASLSRRCSAIVGFRLISSPSWVSS